MLKRSITNVYWNRNSEICLTWINKSDLLSWLIKLSNGKEMGNHVLGVIDLVRTQNFPKNYDFLLPDTNTYVKLPLTQVVYSHLNS